MGHLRDFSFLLDGILIKCILLYLISSRVVKSDVKTDRHKLEDVVVPVGVENFQMM